MKYRVSEIDWLKGFSILCVLLIHARPIENLLAFEHLINRAVPMFIVLFGVTSELWWQSNSDQPLRANLRAWYGGRLLRLMLPVWGMLILWWILVGLYDLRGVVSLGRVIATAIGYTPWIGTGWFITLILGLVIVFPLVRTLVDRLGWLPCLIGAAAVTIAVSLQPVAVISFMRRVMWDTAPGNGFYYIWIFFPAKLTHVIAGIIIARRTRGLATRDALWAGALVAAGMYMHISFLSDPLVKHALRSLLDIPLTVVMLVLLSGLRYCRPCAEMLCWFGVASWGVYMGQMLVHNAVHILVGWPELMDIRFRWLYFVTLFVGSVGLVHIGSAVKTGLSHLFRFDQLSGDATR